MKNLKIIQLLLTLIVIVGNVNLYAQWNMDLEVQGVNDFDRFGEVVAMNADGSVIAVSALTYDGSGGSDTGHVKIYQKISGIWYSLGAIEGVNSNYQTGNAISLSADGMTLAIGTKNGSTSGHVKVFKRISSSWVQQGLTIEGVFANVYCGSSVSLSSDGLTVAIGYLGANSFAGKVSVYQLTGGAWTLLGSTLFGSVQGDLFGYSIDLSGDGARLAIGAHGNDDAGSNAGQVKCFQYNGSNWSQLGVNINGIAVDDNFGQSISLSRDGTTLAVGAPNNDNAGNGAGLVRVYKHIGGNWVQQGSNLLGEAIGDYFGSSVSINSDGTVLAIGARDHDYFSTDDGQVKVYSLNSNTWTQLHQDINYNFFDSGLGGTVSINDDGTSFVVGVRNATLTGTQKGVAQVYSSCSATTGTDTQIACNSYTWIDGNTYSSSNTSATHILTNSAGCDSVVTLNLIVNQLTAGTDTQTACNTYTWIDGNTYTSSNNSATHTLTNSQGCDSIVTLNLIVNQLTAGTDTQTACNTYTWIDGNVYTSNNNSATHTLTNSQGCDSVVTLNLTITSIDATTTTSSETITANQTGASYQWMDCLDGLPITGEINQSFTATTNGEYAVLVSQGSCSETSACVTISTVGVAEDILGNNILLYPNPTEDLVTLELGELVNVQITITDLLGKVIYRKDEVTEQTLIISMKDFADGSYLLSVVKGNDKRIINLIKK